RDERIEGVCLLDAEARERAAEAHAVGTRRVSRSGVENSLFRDRDHLAGREGELVRRGSWRCLRVGARRMRQRTADRWKCEERRAPRLESKAIEWWGEARSPPEPRGWRRDPIATAGFRSGALPFPGLAAGYSFILRPPVANPELSDSSNGGTFEWSARAKDS